jgi:hypothetical protein
VRESARDHLQNARTTLNKYLVDHIVKRDGKEKRVENLAKGWRSEPTLSGSWSSLSANCADLALGDQKSLNWSISTC